ncbi:MAG: Crp/Fnr family transcriptional regulator [Cyanobacteria bacterium P01_G01_bin.38]
MYEKLLQQLNQLVPLNPQQQRELCRAVRSETLPKGSILLSQGEIANELYFVAAGIIRSFCHLNEKEVTRWFGTEGSFCTSYFSFTYRQPSEDSLVLVTDCELLSISCEGLQTLFRTDSAWVDLSRRLLEHYYTHLLERVMSFQTQSTAERYNSFLQEHPGIADQIALGHLASYLGMTQETLSRLRARRKKR